MKVLIDADILTYIAASACNNNKWNYQGKVYTSKASANRVAGEDKDNILFAPEPEKIERVHRTINSTTEELLEHFPMYEHLFFLTSRGNFRDDVGTILKYKDNRKGLEKPFHFQNVRDYYLRYYDALLSHPDLETDDEISMRSRKDGSTVICSTDKDFRQLEGMHFNFNRAECEYVSREEALRNFYSQVLIGDTADNIPGIYRVGEKSVYVLKLLDMKEEEEMFHHVLGVYEMHYRSYAPKFMLENILLLYLVREEDNYWKHYFNVQKDYWRREV